MSLISMEYRRVPAMVVFLDAALISIACRGPLVLLGRFIDRRDAGCHLMVVVLQHLAKIARIEVGAAERTMLAVNGRRL